MSLVALIRDCIKAGPKPCVYIGGGIDSAIILHHLHEKVKEEVSTYTFGFDGEDNEFEAARRVSEHYGTVHREIVIKNMLEKYPEILRLFARPQFNIWVYWLAEAAKADGRQTCYAGEGGDEHFGGYFYKPQCSYTENWVNLYQWGLPAYLTVHKHFELQFETPFLDLDWRETYPYFDYEQHKYYLREAYRGVLPDFVVDRKKNPAARNYWAFWHGELSKFFHNPSVDPKSVEEIRELWNTWVTREWLKVHNGENKK